LNDGVSFAMTARTMLLIASLLGALGVIVGAFGAHWLPGWLNQQGLEPAVVTRRLETLETGVRYHMYHALALLALGLWQRQAASSTASASAWLLLAGIVVFCGGIYAYALTGIRAFAMIVPLGGVSLIAGWIALAVAVTKGP
jgi:uncharacterized membrane protein YgdD (TMEM256/DUF423 family)